jgi:CheY-specific phosphatase CheX
MNIAIQSDQMQQFVFRHLGSVFETMLSMQPKPVAADKTTKFGGNRITGSVSMVGAQVTGQVYLHLETFFTYRAASAMLGISMQDLASDADVNDALGELTNMVAGGLKSWLCDAGALCTLTTPAIIRGNSYQIVHRPGVQIFSVPFECDTQHGLVEIHLKFT